MLANNFSSLCTSKGSLGVETAGRDWQGKIHFYNNLLEPDLTCQRYSKCSEVEHDVYGSYLL